MANFTAGTSFSDGVTNDVTAAKLNALVADAVPTSNLSLNSTTGTIATLNSTTGTIATLNSTTGTIATFNSTTGTIPTLVATTLITTGTGTAAAPAIVPTGDTNTGIFFPAADTIAFSEGGAEAMRIDSSGRVGIGTASPTHNLTLENADTNPYISFNTAGVLKWLVGKEGTQSERFVIASTSAYRMVIDSSGNVGIGNTNPATALETASFGKGLAIGSTSDSANNITIVSSPTSTIAALKFGDGGSGVYDQGYLVYDHTNNSMLMGTNRAERLRIDSSGNVGVGTTSPQKELQINATEPTIRLEESSGGSKRLELSINSSAEAKIFANQSGGTLILGTVATERLRIDSSGNVLVGTTNAGFTSGVGLKFFASATIPSMTYVVNTATSSDSNYHIYNINATNSGYRFYVNSNGGISNFSANNVNLSDERLKTNINPSGNYLDKICSIPVKTFNYKDQGEDTEKTIGVLAQEVEAHIPELINNDGFGETPADGIPLKTIYQTDLQYVLMRCIQEQQAMIQELSAKVTALEAA